MEKAKATHTPSPWEYHIGDGIYASDGRRRIAGLSYGGSAISSKIDIDELMANARLIAAAPDLLAACEAALQFLDANVPYAGDEPVFEILAAAIRKVR